MKKLNLLLLAFLVVMGVTLQSCDDSDGYSLGDVAVDWATVNVKGAHVYDFTGDRCKGDKTKCDKLSYSA